MKTGHYLRIVVVCLIGLLITSYSSLVQARGRAMPKPAGRRAPSRPASPSATRPKPMNPVKNPVKPFAKPSVRPVRPPMTAAGPLKPTPRPNYRKPVRLPYPAVRPHPHVHVGAAVVGAAVVHGRLVVPQTVNVVSEQPVATTLDQSPATPVDTGVLATGADLAVVDICIDDNTSNDSVDRSIAVTATIKNLGEGDYRSNDGYQVFVLYMNGNLVAQCRFSSLLAGDELSIVVEGHNEPAVYEARVIFAQDIGEDGNPWNDDINPRNDLLSRRLDPA